MKWDKRGVIFNPTGEFDWMASHAMVPLADRIKANQYRIYFASRNHQNLSQIGHVDVDITDSPRILYVAKRPVLELGPLGTFDDSAVLPSWIVSRNGKKYMYYVGWMQGKRVRYYASLGLAVSTDGGRTFRKMSMGPLLERNDIDPYFTASCCVLVEEDRWRMWYTSGLGWDVVGDQDIWPPEADSSYHIKYAESDDGIHWIREGVVCVDFRSNEERAIVRPCVVREGGTYRMWYSYRGGSGGPTYRIGYAESDDGLRWERKDSEAGIDVSDSGWDSEMIAYPYVFMNEGTYYMLYNGNDFGRTGIGYATREVLNEQ